MKARLEVTGERLIEGAYLASREAYAIYVMHAASYRFAQSYCQGKRVLDLGCGSGYGVGRLSTIAASVVGVDVSAEAVAFARDTYRQANNRFELIDPAASLPFGDEAFDVVLSFQVIEHVEDELHYLREARRVLAPGGVLVVITPDRLHRLLPGQRPWNRWHRREYSEGSLARIVSQVFSVERVLRMGAPDEVARIEISRYRRTKWLTLPLTFPGVPEIMRRRGLDLLHAFLRKPKQLTLEAEQSTNFDFDENSILIGEDVPNSMNLVLVAKRSNGA